MQRPTRGTLPFEKSYLQAGEEKEAGTWVATSTLVISGLTDFKISLFFCVKDEGWGGTRELGKGPTQKTLPLELPILSQPTSRVKPPDHTPQCLARRIEGELGACTWKGCPHPGKENLLRRLKRPPSKLTPIPSSGYTQRLQGLISRIACAG